MSLLRNLLRLTVSTLLVVLVTATVPAPSFAGWSSNFVGPDAQSLYAPIPGNPWNTFLGADGTDFGYDIAVDGEGNVYITGSSDADWGGSPVNAHAGGEDAFAAKLDSSGVLLWHTFLGGGGTDYGNEIDVDAAGNVYVTGCSSTDWGTPVRAYGIGVDVFVASLNATGHLQWSTFLGGAGNDYGKGIAVAGDGHILVSGDSEVSWGAPVRLFTNFTTDAFAARLDASGSLEWNTFLGGNGNDYGYNIAVDTGGDAYITGESDVSWGTPVRAHFGATYDVFTARLGSDGALAWNTFLGGGGADYGNGVAADDEGNVYVAGFGNASWGAPVRAYFGSTFDAFAARLSSSGNLTWNTFLGGSGDDFGNGIAVGGGNILISGDSGESWGDDPVRAHDGASDDVYAAKLNSSGNLTWNTFLGGTGFDFNYGVAVDSGGNVYAVGDSDDTWGDAPVRAHSGTSGDVFTVKLTGSGALTVPEMVVKNGDVEITCGDDSPSGVDGTDFGEIDINGPTSSHTFRIHNTGPADLVLSGVPNVAVSGDNAADFTITAQPTSPVASGDNTTFQVRFDPSAIGARNALVTIVNDDIDENPYSFNITGTGIITPEINIKQGVNNIIDGGLYGFGAHQVTTVTDVEFVIENTGAANLTLTLPFALVGDADFSITANASAIVLPGENTTFTVRFTPLSLGARSVTINIINNDGDENPYNLTLGGTGLPAPELDISCGGTGILDGGTYDFGSHSSGTDTDAVFLIENTGSANLTLTLPLTIAGADAGQFAIISQPSENVTISENTTFTVRFSPTGGGVKTASINITSSDPDENPYNLVLTGTGSVPPGGGSPAPYPVPVPGPESAPGPAGRIIAVIDAEGGVAALDSLGNPVTFTGNCITISDNGSALTVHIPVALGEGEELASFTDASGMTYAEHELTVPCSAMGEDRAMTVLDENGELDATIVLRTGECRGTGNEAVAEVLGISILTGTAEKPLTVLDLLYRETAASLSLDLADLPDGAVLRISTSLGNGLDAARAFRNAAQDAGLGDISFGFILHVEKTGLTNGEDVRSAIVTMAISPDWVADNGGTGSVLVIRYDEETGLTEVLETVYIGGDDNGLAVFEALSPNGLCSFALVAAGPVPASIPQTTPSPVATATTTAVTTSTSAAIPALTDILPTETFEPQNIEQPEETGLAWWNLTALAALLSMMALLFIAWRRSRVTPAKPVQTPPPPEDVVQ